MRRISLRTICIIVVLAVALTVAVRSVLTSLLNTNAFAPKIALSKTEKAMLAGFSQDCKCDVQFRHNPGLISRTEDVDSPAALIVFNWYKGKGYEQRYFIQDDMCSKDSTFLVQHATGVAKKMAGTVSYRNLYRFIVVHYTTTEIYDDELSGSKCNKEVRFRLTENDSLIFDRLTVTQFK